VRSRVLCLWQGTRATPDGHPALSSSKDSVKSCV